MPLQQIFVKQTIHMLKSCSLAGSSSTMVHKYSIQTKVKHAKDVNKRLQWSKHITISDYQLF